MSYRQEQSNKKQHRPGEADTEGLTEGLVLVALILAIFLVAVKLALVVDTAQPVPVTIDECRTLTSSQWLNLLAQSPGQTVICRDGKAPVVTMAEPARPAAAPAPVPEPKPAVATPSP